MHRVRDNKRPIEQIFVGKPGKSSAHAAGEALVDLTTGYVDFEEGEIKLFSSKGYGTRASNTTIAANDTIVHAPEIFVTQGNKSASDPSFKLPYPLINRPYEESEAISGHERIIYTYRSAKLPTQDIVAVGGAVPSAGAINIIDEAEYLVKIAFFGRDQDEAYSAQCGKPEAMNVNYLSKDYTSLTWNAVQAVDDIIQNLAFQVNQNSTALHFSRGYRPSKPIVAFAVDSTGTNGVNPFIASPGDFLPVVNTKIGIRGIVLTKEIINSFVSSGLPNTVTIVPIDLSKAGGFAAAGTALTGPDGNAYSPAILSGKADHLVLMALDRDLAYEDRIPYVKNRIEVGLLEGFNAATVSNVKVSKASEGEGGKRQWDMFWKNTAGQRIYSNYRGFDAMKIEMPSPVTEDFYDVAIVEHYKVDTVGGTSHIVKPFKVIILIPNALTFVEGEIVPGEEEEPDVTTSTSFVFTPDAGLKALVDNILLPWVRSTDHPIVSVLG